MGKRIFLNHVPFSTIHTADGRKLQFIGDKLELDEDTDADDIAELDKIANRSTVYTPESGLATSPVAADNDHAAGKLAVDAALAGLSQSNETAKMLGQPQQPSQLTNGSVNAAAALLASKAAA